MTKIDTLEREIKELTREVQRLSTMDDMPAFKSLQKDVLQLKKRICKPTKYTSIAFKTGHGPIVYIEFRFGLT